MKKNAPLSSAVFLARSFDRAQKPKSQEASDLSLDEPTTANSSCCLASPRNAESCTRDKRGSYSSKLYIGANAKNDERNPTRYTYNICGPSLDLRKYLLGLSLDFIDALVPAEAHGHFEFCQNRFDDVLHAIGSSESQTICIRPSH